MRLSQHCNESTLQRMHRWFPTRGHSDPLQESRGRTAGVPYLPQAEKMTNLLPIPYTAVRFDRSMMSYGQDAGTLAAEGLRSSCRHIAPPIMGHEIVCTSLK